LKKIYDLDLPTMPENGVPSNTVIAIDGPAGSGKSTLAKQLADTFKLLYVDTGAMYRALTWAAIQNKVDFSNEDALAQLLAQSDLTLDSGVKSIVVRWDSKDISSEIRSSDIEANVSEVASHAIVRKEMVAIQRNISRSTGVVMEGRDIGSVVFPLADVKIYLDASVETRAIRRHKQLSKNDSSCTVQNVQADIIRRDKLDTERKESPLTISPDAMIFDNSNLSISEQLKEITSIVLFVIERSLPKLPEKQLPIATQTLKYKFAVGGMNTLLRFMGGKTYGRENLVRPEGFIIAPNHISLWDPPIIGGAFHGLGAICAVAKEELFKPWPMNHLFSFINTIPIKRAAYDPSAFDRAAEALKQGKCIKFYPEGMRRPVGEPGPVRGGLAILIQKTGAPTVPAFVRGTTEPQPGGSTRSPLEVRFARPVFMDALPHLQKTFDRRAIHQKINSLFNNIYHELQDRTLMETPMTEWEKDQTNWQRIYANKKEKLTFKKRK
jgi:CMP/dCMP kinase